MKVVDTSTEHLNDVIEGLELTKRLLTQLVIECILHPLVQINLFCFLVFFAGGWGEVDRGSRGDGQQTNKQNQAQINQQATLGH